MASHTDQMQIRSLVSRWASAVRARDMSGALAHHTSDIVMFDVPRPLQSKGMKAYEKTWELFFDNSRGGRGSFNIDELKVTAGDTVAFAHGLLRIGGSKAPVGRLTMGFRKEKGQWRISHEHHSYPAD